MKNNSVQFGGFKYVSIWMYESKNEWDCPFSFLFVLDFIDEIMQKDWLVIDTFL